MTPGSMLDTFVAGTFWGALWAMFLMPRATLRAVEAMAMIIGGM